MKSKAVLTIIKESTGKTANMLFHSLTFMTLSAWAAVMLLLAQTIYNFMNQSFELGITHFLIAVCCAALWFSYRRHSKNVMKFLIGFILALTLSTSLHVLSQRITEGTFSADLFGSVFLIVRLALYLLFILNQLLLNSTRDSRPAVIRCGWTVMMLLMILCAVEIIRGISLHEVTVFYIISALKHVALLNTLVCIDTKLDTYRAMRQKAGWTEETGYPKGYDRKTNYGK